jgi:hypothetical protein
MGPFEWLIDSLASDSTVFAIKHIYLNVCTYGDVLQKLLI